MFKNAINCLRVLELQNKTYNIVNSILKYTCMHNVYARGKKKKDLKDKHQNMNKCYLSG